MLIRPPSLSLVKKGFLPNMRRLIAVDRGMLGVDMDLDRADLQVVVAEAEDAELRLAMNAGLDMHLFNASSIFNLRIPADEMAEVHPNYRNWKEQYAPQRQKAKIGVHATNYGAYDRRIAISLGITVGEAKDFRDRWFGAHPGIKRWHVRTKQQLAATRTIYNKFGYRRVYFDRPDMLLSEALAWVPQSTVAIVIDKAMDNICTNLKEVQVMLQVHDSLYMQVATEKAHELIPKIEEQALITIPYPEPLVIPVGFEVSKISWGMCKKYKRDRDYVKYDEQAAWDAELARKGA